MNKLNLWLIFWTNSKYGWISIPNPGPKNITSEKQYRQQAENPLSKNKFDEKYLSLLQKLNYEVVCLLQNPKISNRLRLMVYRNYPKYNILFSC